MKDIAEEENTQLNGRENTFNKMIKEIFSNLKMEIPIKVQKDTEH